MSALQMSAFKGKATCRFALQMSAYDPKRTLCVPWSEMFAVVWECSAPLVTSEVAHLGSVIVTAVRPELPHFARSAAV